MQFVHLKTYSEFSLKKGTNKIKNLVERAVKDNQPAMALTESNGLHSAINFYETARGKGVKPIIGCDFTVEQEDGSTYQLTVLAKNKSGYNSLVALNSRSFLEKNSKFEDVRIKEDWLVDLQDVVVLSGGKDGYIGKLILAGELDEAKLVAAQMKEFFQEDFYIELQRDSSKEQDAYMEGALQICQEVGIPPVATHPVLFPTREDFVAHEIRYCVANKKKFSTVERERPFTPDMHFKTTEEMTELFSDIPVALENTVKIAQKCNLSLTLGQNQLPRFPTPNGEGEAAYFEKFSREGLEKRLEKIFPDPQVREKSRKEYDERFERELGIINKMEFPGYFLIVSDFINWAKSNDIPIGPGRGSGAGSLIAYAMGITDVNPLPYGLLFERFLNPERVSMPDFDIDMCQSRRGEIIEYVRNKYGSESVCQIGTFSTMATKSVIRDVGRALDMGHDEVDQIAKMIFIPVGKHIPLKNYIWGGQLKDGTEVVGDEKLLTRYNNDVRTKKLIDVALRLEGMTKNMGTHASGVLIAPKKLTEFTALYTIGKDVEAPVSQFHMGDVEKAGLVKFDFLGLKNLTVINGALRLIEERRGQKLDLESIDLQDPDVLKNVFASGNTTSVFQFESKGMKSVLKRAKPECFEDLAALNALFRPGPMDIIPDYIASKENPAKRTYPHKMLENILKETYGFMVYQEQVMQVAQVMGGYSLGGADLLRRAMGKKKVEEMQKHREIFCDGAEKNGVDREQASEIFSLMEKFAGYGFNKSHAVAYALVAYQTGFLKHYYPSEFLTSNLNLAASVGNTDKIATIFQDCRENNIPLTKVDVNFSDQFFKIESDGSIRYALTAIKGAAEKDVMEIQREREMNGPYIDLFDFIERIGAKGRAGKKTLEGLAKSGAFDSLEPNRALVFEMVESLSDYAKNYKKFVSAAPKRLNALDMVTDSLPEETTETPAPAKGGLKRKSPPKAPKDVVKPERPVLNEVEPWSELVAAQMEKESLGMYFSIDPFTSYYAKQLSNPKKGFEAITPLNELREFAVENGQNNKYGAKTYIAGMVEELFLFKEGKGARAKISDGKSTVDVVMFKETFAEYGKLFEEGSFISMQVSAKIKETDENPEAKAASSLSEVDSDGEVIAHETETSDAEPELDLFVNSAFNFEQTKELLTSVLFVGIPDTPEAKEIFMSIASQYPGQDHKNTSIVKMALEDPVTKNRTIPGPSYSIRATEQCVKDFKNAFGDKWVLRRFKEEFDKVIFPELVSNKGKKKSWGKGR